MISNQVFTLSTVELFWFAGWTFVALILLVRLTAVERLRKVLSAP